MHPNFVSRLPRKVLGWFISTWSTLVYTNNFSLTRYLSVFVIRVDDQQVFLYNFPLTRFLRLGRRHDRQVFLDKFRLCLQCLMISGVLRKLGPSLMPRPKTKWHPQKELAVSGKEALLLLKNKTV